MRSVVLGLALVAIMGTGAYAKPKIAILGLEVVGNLDPDQVKLAKQLTNALRERASAGTGPYDLAPNSDKELVDEKLMNNCGTEALTCMSPIGLSMRADFLMYGKMEKVDKGFHVTIKLIRVATKMPLPTFSEIVPATDVKNDPKGLAKRAYSMMTATDEGTVTIRVARVDRATVYINDQPMGTTSSGVLTISVPEGTHRLAVVATEKGWKRHEEELQINAGDQRNIPVDLVRVQKGEDPPPKPPKVEEIKPPGGELTHMTEGAESEGGSRAGWRVMFAVSLATGLGGGGAWFYGYREIGKADRKHIGICNTDFPIEGGRSHTLDECKPKLANVLATDERLIDANEQGQRGKIFTWIGAGGVAVGAVFSMFTLYKGFIAKPEKRVVGGGAIGRSTRPRRTLTVTPVWSPAGGGATLRFDW
jgi:hypothetical protein